MKSRLFILFLVIAFANNLSVAQTQSDEARFPLFAQTAFDVDTLLKIVDVSPGLTLDGRKPLLLVHGWSFEGKPARPGSGFWDHFKNYLLNNPELSASFKPYYVEYWSNAVSVETLGALLRDKMEEAGLHEQNIAIIGHSMGGLVSRSYMNEHSFSKGKNQGHACGDMVDLLITLASPHHGSPMANNKARNSKFVFPLSIYVTIVEAAVFKESKSDEVNRSDLRWDNFDNLMNYTAYPEEKNDWLVNLNQSTQYDPKTICYTASVKGEYKTNPATLEEQYQLGAYLIEQGFKLNNDGIVPVKSSAFDGHTVKNIRHFDNYNHADIVRGKVNKNELFDPMKIDLMEVAPFVFKSPIISENTYLKAGKVIDIKWNAPSTMNKVNVYLSTNSGASYGLIAANVNAADKKISWTVPNINASNCLLKIVNTTNISDFVLSDLSFGIYFNEISFEAPGTYKYFVLSKENNIVWTQSGIGTKVKITYRDEKNNINQTLADNLSVVIGDNTFQWIADSNILPTDRGIISIQILDDFSNYADYEDYTFSSSAFNMLGEPRFEFLSPQAGIVDALGVEGEQFKIGSTQIIKWKAEGEIKWVEFNLCDSNKTVIMPIVSELNAPKYSFEQSTRWHVPELSGNKFYYSARVGYSYDSIYFEAFSEQSFRINQGAGLVNLPSLDAFPLYPCFYQKEIPGATSYEFYLTSIAEGDEVLRWEYSSAEPIFCLPNNIENELIPGEHYQIFVAAIIDGIQTYTDQVNFMVEKSAPSAFKLVKPINQSKFETSGVEVLWNHSSGAASYKVELFQNNQLLTAVEGLGRADTSIIADMATAAFYEDITLKVTAINPFGTVSSESVFEKIYPNGIDEIQRASNLLLLKNYPNPFHTETQIVFNLKNDEPEISLAIYDLMGQNIAQIASGRFSKGEHAVLLNRDNLNGKRLHNGVYLILLQANQMKKSSLLLVE